MKWFQCGHKYKHSTKTKVFFYQNKCPFPELDISLAQAKPVGNIFDSGTA